MHSHVSVVHNGQANYIQETSKEKCLYMHKEGILRVGLDDILDQLKPNRTFYRSAVLAGKIGVDGTCKGALYSDLYGTWDDVVVQAALIISLRTAYVPIHLETGKIMLKSGTVCPLADGHCLDSQDGHTFWQPLIDDSCKFNNYDVLYEGIATKLRGGSESHKTTIFSLTTQDITFALTQTRPHVSCGYTILGTEHPKLFIFETTQGNIFKRKTETQIDNLDMFAYINSKFVYVERHLRTQMTALYHNIIQQKCELEKQVLQNTLSLATILPDEFAFRLMKTPGYMAVAAGEVIHVLKCIPIDVSLRRTNTCHTDLPVTLRNASYFLTPKSRILTRHSTIRECNPLLPVLYHIEDTWIQFNPTPNLILPPQTLKPLTSLTWTYMKPSPLATSGIYSEKELENLRNHIMFPAEKSAVLHTIARGFAGHPMNDQGVSIQHLLDEDALNKIYTNTASKLWSGFITFGSATAGLFGIFIIIRLIKIIFDTLVHGYALHSAYGCSIHLLGALLSSVTHLLLHLAKGPQEKTTVEKHKEPTNNETKDIENGTTTPLHNERITGTIPSGYTYRELQAEINGTR